MSERRGSKSCFLETLESTIISGRVKSIFIKTMNQNTKELEKWDTEPWCSIEGILFDIEAMALTPEEAVHMLDKHIAQLLLSQRNELVGDARKLVKDDGHDDQICDPPFDGCGCAIDDYNQGVSDVIALINKKP